MAKVRLSSLAVALAAFFAAPASDAAPGVPCAFYGLNAGAPVWNGQVFFDLPFAKALAETGARSVRIDFRLDGAASWDAAKLAQYDGIVDAALAAGLEPLGLMAYEAVPGDQVAWNDDPDLDGYNAYVADFAAASATLLPHFAGKIPRWELWNEPSCWSNPQYAADPQHAGCTYLLPRVFAKLMAEVYVKNEALLASKQVSLVSGGVFAHDIGGSFTTGTDYLGEVYAQGVWDWMQANEGRRYPWDALGYHLYVEQGQSSDGTKLAAYLDDVRALMTSKNDATPFAITEIGWTTAAVTPDVQAQNLTQAFSTLSARPDVARTYWFSYRDAGAAGLYFGVADDGGNPKPAAAALHDAAMGCEPGGAGGSAGTGGSGGSTSGGTGGMGSSSSSSGAAGSGGATGSSSSGSAGASSSGDGGAASPGGSGSPGGCGCEAAGALTGDRFALCMALLGLGLAMRRASGRRG